MEYLITQTMAEYLSHLHNPAFDGVLFKSVQQAGGTNAVLFRSEDNCFPLAYVDESFQLFSTSSVEYKHQKRYVGRRKDGEIWIGYDDIWDDQV